MSIFSKLMDSILGPNTAEYAVPGAMGMILAQMGIHELGPHRRQGIPDSVRAGCPQLLTVIPGSDRPATRKDGTPIMARDKHGKEYLVMDQYAIPTKRWKQMQREQARKAAGRWYSGAPA